jgi:hypothetical protein
MLIGGLLIDGDFALFAVRPGEAARGAWIDNGAGPVIGAGFGIAVVGLAIGPPAASSVTGPDWTGAGESVFWLGSSDTASDEAAGAAA